MDDKATVTLQGKVNGIIVSIEYETVLDLDIFDKVVTLSLAAQKAGWTDPTPKVTGGGWGGGSKQKSRLEIDPQTNRVKLFPVYSLVATRDDPNGTKAKRAAFIKNVQDACGVKNLKVPFVWNKVVPKESFYWVGMIHAAAMWKHSFFAEWEKTPATVDDSNGQG